jgi:hypothetical protein
MLYGGLLVTKQDTNVHRLSFAVVLPRPLNSGERSEFALRFTVLDGQIMQPHYICVPRQRCALFDLRVRFDRNRLPRQVWQLSKASKHDINDRQEGEPVEVDATGELHLQFNELSPRYGYGARWEETR